MKLSSGLVAGMVFLSPAMALARDSVAVLWSIQALDNPDLSERTVLDGEYVLRQKLLPMGLATLDGPAALTTGNRLHAKAGAQLVKASSDAGEAYCALETHRLDKAGAQIANSRGVTLCFLDANKDGRFESLFEVPGGGVIVQGAVPDKRAAIDIGYATRPVGEMARSYWVGIRYEQYFNIYGNRMFFIDFGPEGQMTSLTDFAKFKSAGPYPQTFALLDSQFSVLEAQEKGIRLRVDKAIPAQPFGVFTYTSYR
ncbi:hypothetical protein LWE61_13510 [Sphingobium sufflavum]|uniref:hypothetical protein n=1 Tax=Sphingobium sufflavum TaxID=1129547 RepID=UPI001F24F5BD|nr:hypothetical protein [Sphingobium sufflavum]MCE7797563.1 hypothetical protein [Sphingobium sufflavum]